MTRKIFFGDIVIKFTKSKQKQTVTNIVFTENSAKENTLIIERIKRKIRNKKTGFKILQYCYDTAKHVGDTLA